MDELIGREGAELDLAGIGRAVAKGDLIVFELDQTAVANGDPEDIRSEILEGRAAVADRFAVDDPVLFPDGGRDIVGEARFLQGVVEFGLEDLGEGFNGEQEVMVGRQPGAVVS